MLLRPLPGREAIFFPDGYSGFGNAGRWVVRTSGDPAALAPSLRAAIAQINPNLTLSEVQPMQAFVDKSNAPTRFAVVMIGIFATIALALSAIGLYGVLSTIVRMRTAEIGLRMVFGALRDSILRLVIGEGFRLSALGIACGLVAAFGVTGVMRSMLVCGDADRSTDLRHDHRALHRDCGPRGLDPRAPRGGPRSNGRAARGVARRGRAAGVGCRGHPIVGRGSSTGVATVSPDLKLITVVVNGTAELARR